MNRKIPRPPIDTAASPYEQPPQQASGFGRRSRWPLPPVGEAARRNPYIPDPVPNDGPPRSQADASPPVEKRGGMSVGGGIDYNGFPAELKFVKRIGNMVTRALARNLLMGTVDAQWRVGGVSLPPDYGMGIGAQPAADLIWPQNPQVYMRNPGIHPIAGLPQTYRYAANMPSIQDVGPSIGDVGSISAR